VCCLWRRDKPQNDDDNESSGGGQQQQQGVGPALQPGEEAAGAADVVVTGPGAGAGAGAGPEADAAVDGLAAASAGSGAASVTSGSGLDPSPEAVMVAEAPESTLLEVRACGCGCVLAVVLLPGFDWLNTRLCPLLFLQIHSQLAASVRALTSRVLTLEGENESLTGRLQMLWSILTRLQRRVEDSEMGLPALLELRTCLDGLVQQQAAAVTGAGEVLEEEDDEEDEEESDDEEEESEDDEEPKAAQWDGSVIAADTAAAAATLMTMVRWSGLNMNINWSVWKVTCWLIESPRLTSPVTASTGRRRRRTRIWWRGRRWCCGPRLRS